MKKQFLKGLLIKITSAVSATVLVFSAFAADTQAAAYNKVYSETDTTSTKAVWPDAPDVNSNSCILIDADTGSILFERNSHEKCYPASTTKILTGLLTIENCNMDDVVTFSQSAANSINVYEDANLSSKAGEQFTVNQLLHGLLLYSANEMAYALGEHVAGSIDAFVDMMNAKARDKVDNHGILGITGSTVSDEAVQIYGIPQGVFVSEVTEGGPADDAGITKNMVITEFDGKTITSIDQLVELLQYYEPKEKIDVTVAVLDGNEYKEKTLTVKLGKDDSASKDSSEESAAQDSQDSQDSQDESIEGGQDGSDQGDANAFADDGEASLFRDFEQNGLRD